MTFGYKCVNMDNIASSLDRAKKYEAFSIFSNDRFTSLVSGIRLADCMKAEISYLDDELEEQGVEFVFLFSALKLFRHISQTCYTVFKLQFFWYSFSGKKSQCNS